MDEDTFEVGPGAAAWIVNEKPHGLFGATTWNRNGAEVHHFSKVRLIFYKHWSFSLTWHSWCNSNYFNCRWSIFFHFIKIVFFLGFAGQSTLSSVDFRVVAEFAWICMDLQDCSLFGEALLQLCICCTIATILPIFWILNHVRKALGYARLFSLRWLNNVKTI